MRHTPIKGFYAIVDPSVIEARQIEGAALSLLKGGAKVLQLRAKDTPSGKLLPLCKKLCSIANDFGAIFIVNDRCDLAKLSGANGVHLGQDDLPLEEARNFLGHGAIIGISTHNVEEAILAEKRGADYISFGPIFPTSTKKDAQSPKGLGALKEAASSVRIPIVAIGGLDIERAKEALCSGASSVAMISEILLADDIEAKAAEVVSSLKR